MRIPVGMGFLKVIPQTILLCKMHLRCHRWLYIILKQKRILKFDGRPFIKNNSVFESSHIQIVWRRLIDGIILTLKTVQFEWRLSDKTYLQPFIE